MSLKKAICSSVSNFCHLVLEFVSTHFIKIRRVSNFEFKISVRELKFGARANM